MQWCHTLVTAVLNNCSSEWMPLGFWDSWWPPTAEQVANCYTWHWISFLLSLHSFLFSPPYSSPLPTPLPPPPPSLPSIHPSLHFPSSTPSSFHICQQTIGAAFGAKKVSVSGESVTLGIWVSVGCRFSELRAQMEVGGVVPPLPSQMDYLFSWFVVMHFNLDYHISTIKCQPCLVPALK